MKEVFSKSKIPFVLSIITFVIGCLFAYLSRIDPWNCRLIITLLGFVPFVLFLILTFIANCLYGKKYTETITVVISGFLTWGLLGYYFFVLIIGAVYESENPITDVRHYKGIINDSYLLSTFPEEIPNNVENVSFVYAPGLMQGDTGISLYYKDESLNEEVVDSKFGDISIRIGNWNEFSNDGMFEDLSFKNTPVEEDRRKEFKVYLVDSQCDESGYCNHGEFLFVAFNEESHEIIYKYCHW